MTRVVPCGPQSPDSAPSAGQRPTERAGTAHHGPARGTADAGRRATEAPHLDVSVFARGMLDRVVTRIYFDDEADANAADPVLQSIPDAARRATLIATSEPGIRPSRGIRGSPARTCGSVSTSACRARTRPSSSMSEASVPDASAPLAAGPLTGPSGAPVLVLGNSLGTSAEVWERQVPALRDSFRLLRYELPGHGGSAAPPGPYTIAQLGRRVLALLDEREVDRAAYCGHLARRDDRHVARRARSGADQLARPGLHVRAPAARRGLADPRGAGTVGRNGLHFRWRRRALVHTRLRGQRARGDRPVPRWPRANRRGGLRRVLRGHRRNGPAARSGRNRSAHPGHRRRGGSGDAARARRARRRARARRAVRGDSRRRASRRGLGSTTRHAAAATAPAVRDVGRAAWPDGRYHAL